MKRLLNEGMLTKKNGAFFEIWFLFMNFAIVFEGENILIIPEFIPGYSGQPGAGYTFF